MFTCFPGSHTCDLSLATSRHFEHCHIKKRANLHRRLFHEKKISIQSLLPYPSQGQVTFALATLSQVCRAAFNGSQAC